MLKLFERNEDEWRPTKWICVRNGGNKGKGKIKEDIEGWSETDFELLVPEHAGRV